MKGAPFDILSIILSVSPLLVCDILKAVKCDVMFSNPCERVEPPKLRRKEAASLDGAQTKALLEAVEEKALLQYHVMVKLMIFSGAMEASVSQGKKNRTGVVWSLSGLMYCADCGNKMRLNYNNTTNGSKKNPRRYFRHNYTCGSYSRSGKLACSSHYIKLKDKLLLYSLF